MNCCTHVNEVWYGKSSWTYLQVLFDEVFKYGHDAKFEVMLRQTVNHSADFCNFVQCPIFAN
jgi:hypothetical protein